MTTLTTHSGLVHSRLALSLKRRASLIVLSFLLTLTVQGCGQKGALTLPEKPPEQLQQQSINQVPNAPFQ